MDELKPCPSCGGDTTLDRDIWHHDSGTLPLVTFIVRCEDCGIETHEHTNVQDAIDEWNWEMQ